MATRASIIGMRELLTPTTDFDYDKWYSLETLGEALECFWVDLPKASPSIIHASQNIKLLVDKLDGVEDLPEYTTLEFNENGAMLGCNGYYPMTHIECFKIIPDELIINIEGI